MFFELEQLHPNLVNSLIAVAILLLFLFFRKIFTKYVYSLILYLTRKTPTDFLANIWMAFEKPIRTLFIVVGVHISASYFPYFDTEIEIYKQIMITLVIILITWGMFNLSSTSSIFFHKLNNKLDVGFDQIVIPFLSKTIQFIVIVVGLSVIVQVFGYNINSIVAGLGIGGLAVALAAQDALSNLFGGIVIISEKPFTIDDWVETPSVEGTVEDIGFRSTTIRTFGQALVTVPNATLAKETITNWSEMGKRRVSFKLGIAKRTPPEQIESLTAKIDNLLKQHEEIHKETIFVTFDSFDTSSLDLFIYFFTKTTDWEKYLKIKEAINLQILRFLIEEEVELAHPARRLFVSKEDEDEGLADRVTNAEEE